MGAIRRTSSSPPIRSKSTENYDSYRLLTSYRLSREEREELYKLARERIFGSSEEAAASGMSNSCLFKLIVPYLPDIDNNGDNEMSRASSVSTNNRSNVGKRGKAGKQRRDDSDSFDSRHQYTPYWGPQQQTWVPQQQPQAQMMAPPAGQFGGQVPTTYPGQMAPAYAAPGPQAFPPAPGMAPNATYPGYPMPQVPQVSSKPPIHKQREG